MDRTPEHIRLVVVGPSDVEGHVAVIERVADELNHLFDRFRLQLLVKNWRKDTHPGAHEAGGQGRIDEDLQIENCEILIGIFRRLFGSSLSSGESATAAEVRKGYDSWTIRKAPQLQLYFDQEPAKAKTTWELDQERQILEFREQFQGKLLHMSAFSGELEFERQVRTDLTDYILDRLDARGVAELSFPPGVLTCSVGSNPFSVRAEGLTELAGEITLTFRGAKQALPNPARESKITLFLNTSITNRITDDGLTDAILVGYSREGQFCCRGRLTATHAVEFSLILDDALLDTQMRIMNLRVNANALGLHLILPEILRGLDPSLALAVSQSGFPVVAHVVADDLSLTNPKQIIGHMTRAINTEFALVGRDSFPAIFHREVSQEIVQIATVRFCEASPNSLRPRLQNNPARSERRLNYVGKEYVTPRSESGFQNNAFSDQTDTMVVSGLADFGTRLVVGFQVIAGVQIFVSRKQLASSAEIDAVALSSEAGPFAPLQATSNCGGIELVEVPLEGSVWGRPGHAVWEIVGRASEQPGYVEFGVFISYEAQPEAHLPLLGTSSFGFRPQR